MMTHLSQRFNGRWTYLGYSLKYASCVTAVARLSDCKDKIKSPEFRENSIKDYYIHCDNTATEQVKLNYLYKGVS
jgi:hypothetical protein